MVHTQATDLFEIISSHFVLRVKAKASPLYTRSRTMRIQRERERQVPGSVSESPDDKVFDERNTICVEQIIMKAKKKEEEKQEQNISKPREKWKKVRIKSSSFDKAKMR